MASPFAGVVREDTLTFEVGGYSATEKDDFGNPLRRSRQVVVKVFLRLRGRTDTTRREGVDRAQEVFEGYCIDPLKLPDTIETGSIADANIGGNQGKFQIEVPTPTPFEVVTEVLGDRIRGVFIR